MARGWMWVGSLMLAGPFWSSGPVAVAQDPAVPEMQGAEAPKSKVVHDDLSPEQVDALRKVWETGLGEIGRDWKRYETPDVAQALTGGHGYVVSIVTVTGVELPDGKGFPYSRLKLRVEQTLAGDGGERELRAESRWVPMTPEQRSMRTGGGPRETVIDREEPRIGNRYLLGYMFLDEGAQGKRAWICGGFDLGDPEEARIFPEVQRVLAMVAAGGAAATDASPNAGAVNVGPYVGALGSDVPWIRDLAARQLIESEACSNSPSCVGSFLSGVRHLLGSKTAAERMEGLRWMEPLALPMGDRKEGANGLSRMSDGAVRALMASAVEDGNAAVGDKAFEEVALFDFFHSAGPGECIEVVPRVRGSARWTKAEASGVMIGNPFGNTTTCIPEP